MRKEQHIQLNGDKLLVYRTCRVQRCNFLTCSSVWAFCGICVLIVFVRQNQNFVHTQHCVVTKGQARMPRNASSSSSSVDARTVLKTYNISTVNPKRWQDTSVQRPKQRSDNNRRQNRYSVLQDQRLDFDEEATRTHEIVEDEDDPLGIVRDGVFRYSPSSAEAVVGADHVVRCARRRYQLTLRQRWPSPTSLPQKAFLQRIFLRQCIPHRRTLSWRLAWRICRRAFSRNQGL